MKKCAWCDNEVEEERFKFCSEICRAIYKEKKASGYIPVDYLGMKLKEKGLRYDQKSIPMAHNKKEHQQ